MTQVPHFGDPAAQAHGGSDCRGGLEIRDWYQASIFFWTSRAIPFFVMFRAHPIITQFWRSLLSSAATQLEVVIMRLPCNTKILNLSQINAEVILSTTPQDARPVRRWVGEKEREKAKMKMQETHKVQYILQGSFSELNVATFLYLFF